VEPSKVWVRKVWTKRFDKIISQKVSQTSKVLQSQCHPKHGPVLPQDCYSKEILGNINEEAVAQGQKGTRAMVPGYSVMFLHNLCLSSWILYKFYFKKP